jgi:hypothetical protein
MSFRLILVVALFGALIGGCVTTNDDDGLDRMQRNHSAAVESAA